MYVTVMTDFEAGISSRQETLLTKSKFGVITHTLITSADPTNSDEPPEKREKIDLPIMEEGYARCFELDKHVFITTSTLQCGIGFSRMVKIVANYSVEFTPLVAKQVWLDEAVHLGS